MPEDERAPIFAFLESKYEDKLSHLKNRISLYHNLYSYMNKTRLLPKNEKDKNLTFNEFLGLKDHQIFKDFFEV